MYVVFEEGTLLSQQKIGNIVALFWNETVCYFKYYVILMLNHGTG